MRNLNKFLISLLLVSQPLLSLAQQKATNQKAALKRNGPASYFEPWPTPISGDNPDFVAIKKAVYTDKEGRHWIAPQGTKTDGASIPQACLSFIGDRFDIRWRTAALIHDAYCGDANVGQLSYHQADWRDVHRMFYNACLAGGTPEVTAKIMYAAIWLFGPKWEYPPYRGPGGTSSPQDAQIEKSMLEVARLNAATIPDDLKQRQLQELADYIKDENPSVDRLDGVLESATYSLQQKLVIPLPGSH